ncbi:uncharacterized protein LOC105282650 isoform X3 [Ooceraea biroi]|uniref:uncharacterized protein LOC105282650 isoform X3 n=1 Tax=Ooceraea biroi TaxID=2015173 RepID=UPI0005BC02EA|nr:uncharacterized protein LOC105282650 isoform X3 [Ooceraea biroi]
MIGVSTGVIILFGFLLAAAHSREERLSCYECNTDLRQGHKGDCNDPYTPGDLVACPQNEPHRCHKSIVLCRRVLQLRRSFSAVEYRVLFLRRKRLQW